MTGLFSTSRFNTLYALEDFASSPDPYFAPGSGVARELELPSPELVHGPRRGTDALCYVNGKL